MKMYFYFIFVVSIGFFLIFGAAESPRELIIISTPQKTHDNRMQTKLTCVASQNGSALFWLSNGKSISSFDDCAITWDPNDSCKYDSSTSSVKFIKRSGDNRPGDWYIELHTKYPTEPDGLRTRLLGDGYCQYSGWRDNLNESESLVFFGKKDWNGKFFIKFSDGTNDTVSSFDLPKLKQKHVINGEWSTYSMDWNKTALSINNEIVKTLPGNKSFVAVKLMDPTLAAFYGYCYLQAKGREAFLNFDVHPSGDDLCLDLLVRGSPNCQFIIDTSLSLKKTYSIFSIESSWVTYIIKEKLKPNYPHHLKLLIFTKCVDNTACKCFFHSIRPCQSNSSIEKSRRTSVLTDSVMNPVRCQEILPGGGSVVVSPNRSITNITLNVPKICLEEKKSVFDQECGDSCDGMSICDSISCTYAPGFKDRGCDQGHCTSYPNYSLRVYIHYCGNWSAKDLRDDSFKMQNEENPEKWELIRGDRINDNTWLWPNKIIESLQPGGIYWIRAELNETEKSLATDFNVSYLVPVTLGNFTAKLLKVGIVELNWQYSQIHWQNVKWFYLRIDLLNSKNMSFRYPMGKFYPIKSDVSEYSGRVFLETDAEYKIILYILTDENKNKLVFGAHTNCKTYRKQNGSVTKKDLQIDRNETSIFIERSSIVNNIGDGSVEVVIHGSFDCASELNTPHDDNIEWEVMTYKNISSMPESLQISNVSECKLLSDEAYVVKVLVKDTDENRYLFIINVEKLPQSYVYWITFSVTSLFCCLTFSYIFYRYPIARRLLDRFMNPYQTPHLLICEPETIRYDSNAYSKRLVAFENAVKRHAQDGVLEQQFMRLPKGLVRPCEYGLLPDNQWKNRNGSPIAYDDTRVMLVQKPRDRYSDYINANYIQGYLKKNAYIATQAPLSETVEDFWRMVWQEDVRIICMLVDLIEGEKVMCEMYWPDVGKKVEYGDLIVSNLAEQELSDYTCRTFVVSRRTKMEQRQIDHLQYRRWTDQEIPMHTHCFLEFLQKLRSIAPGPGPIVVHCCADIGRTGCVILCDICVCQIYDKETVNVRSEAEKMYHARANMLHNCYQYTLAHLMPIQFRRALATVIPVRDLSPEKIQEMKNESSEHMQWLKCFAWMHEALRPLKPLRPTHPENVSKNRFPKLMPVGPSLMTLPKYPPDDETSDYISAVSVDGFKTKKQYLASQLPMPGTLTDFWRLIVQENVELIVILQNPDLDDPTCCAIIARDKTVIPYPFVKVETKMSLESNEYFTTTMLLLTDSTEKPTKTRTITAIICNDWRWNQITSPPPPEALVKLWFTCHAIKRTSAPTLVLCYDGVTASGIYIALSFILEKMCMEQECDVIAAVQAVHRSRSEFVQVSWQIDYLYDAALKYMELSEEYGNFN